MKKALTICFIIFGLGMLIPVSADEPVATEGSALQTLMTRQQIIEQAQQVLSEAPSDEARQETLNEAIRETFDFDRLGRESIARHWEAMTDEQKSEYTRLFRVLVEKSTVRKLKAYRAAGTEYTAVEEDSSEAVITTVVTSTDGDEVAIQYKMHRVNGRWWIWDTTIGLDIEISEYDASSAENYRSAFNRIVSDEGVEGVLQRLRSKYQDGAEL